MNWYRKANISTVNRLDWETIARKLEEKLGREPTSDEIQEVLYKEYWEPPAGGQRWFDF